MNGKNTVRLVINLTLGINITVTDRIVGHFGKTISKNHFGHMKSCHQVKIHAHTI
jgi:hypothetical protein